MVPTGLENRENLEKWEGIFQSGKSQGILSNWKILLKILEKSEKNTGKLKKKNTGKVREICQPVIVKNPANMVPYFK